MNDKFKHSIMINNITSSVELLVEKNWHNKFETNQSKLNEVFEAVNKISKLKISINLQSIVSSLPDYRGYNNNKSFDFLLLK